jgi:hypothetical protein
VGAVVAATDPRRAIIESMPANDRMPSAWSRRSLLVAMTVGLAGVLSGCRVRLEDDAPRIPGLPTRQPMTDEPALLLARREAVRLGELAAGQGHTATGLTDLLATVHARQADVLETVLRAGGVPTADITAAPRATATETATGTATAGSGSRATTGSTASGGETASAPSPVPSGVSELVAAEAEGMAARALSDLAGVSRDQVALLAAMTAQRAAAVRLLGGRLPPARSLTGPTGEIASAQLEAIRSAVYAFEVIVAQSDVSHRRAAARTLAALRASSAELRLLAGSAGKPTTLGYALPFPVATPAQALKLATDVMTALRAAIASQIPALAGDEAGLEGTVRLLAEVCVHAVTWRVPLTAFPGLSNP